VEHGALAWFGLPEDDKDAEGGAYGHVDRKFTGYRNGKFREQLEVRQTLDHSHGGIYPRPSTPAEFGDELASLITFLDGTARGLLRHIAVDCGAEDGFFEELLDPPPPPPPKPGKEKGHNLETPPTLGHSLIRLCKYNPEDAGVYGGNVLCEAHNDVGFITLDACASVAGLEALRRADSMWVPVEEAPRRDDGSLVLVAMVGDTLGRLSANYYAPCKHRVVQPPSGVDRIGLPFLFRGRSDAVLNTVPTRERCAREGRTAHLAQMETTTIKELPAFDSAKAILNGWFKSMKGGEAPPPEVRAYFKKGKDESASKNRPEAGAGGAAGAKEGGAPGVKDGLEDGTRDADRIEATDAPKDAVNSNGGKKDKKDKKDCAVS